MMRQYGSVTHVIFVGSSQRTSTLPKTNRRKGDFAVAPVNFIPNMPRIGKGINTQVTISKCSSQVEQAFRKSFSTLLTSEKGEKEQARRFAAGPVFYSHETMEGLLCSGRHRLIPRQFPVFQSESSGKTTSRASRSKLSAVLSSNRMVMTSTSGSTSTLSTVLPLTWGNWRNRLVRLLRGCVPLEVAIGRLSNEGDLWSGARSCENTGESRLCLCTRFGGAMQRKRSERRRNEFR